MQISKYIYTFSYDNAESELCKLESRCIFSKEERNRVLSSDIKIDPADSAYIKKRLDIITFSDDYDTLINAIKKEAICIEGFKIEYLVVDGDTTEYTVRLKKLREIGYSIDGDTDYYTPIITYGLCYYKGIWRFGILHKDDFVWHKHKQKPCSYSNSISMSVAKALVNIAAKANKEKKLLDACCGVGTIMLEACFSGNIMEGCDINEKICMDARKNLSHFNYTAPIYCSDIKDISLRYDAAIIDLPYNLFSRTTDNAILHIIQSTAKITDRLVIVSTSDITNLINNTGLKLLDYCSAGKRGKTKFARKIWVCEKIG